MNAEFAPDKPPRMEITLQLTDSYTDTIRSMAIERISLSMQNNQPPRHSDVIMANLDTNALRLSCAEDMMILARHLHNFALDADRDITHAQMVLSKELADEFIAERHAKSAYALELADELLAEYELVLARKQSDTID